MTTTTPAQKAREELLNDLASQLERQLQRNGIMQQTARSVSRQFRPAFSELLDLNRAAYQQGYSAAFDTLEKAIRSLPEDATVRNLIPGIQKLRENYAKMMEDA